MAEEKKLWEDSGYCFTDEGAETAAKLENELLPIALDLHKKGWKPWQIESLIRDACEVTVNCNLELAIPATKE